MLNSPLSWMGGKFRLRQKIIDLIPEDHDSYVEVFGGAAWVLFGKDKSNVEVYNDINSELVNFFRVLKYHSDEFRIWIEKDIVSREIFEEYKDTLERYLTDIQRAVRFYYIVKYSFASKGDSFGYSVKKIPYQGVFETSFVNEVRDRLRSCYVEKLPFDVLIKKYDRPKTFFYCDPPYYKTAQYKDKFDKEDHLKLVNILKNINGLFLLTINEHPEVREWYKDFCIIEANVNYSISKEPSGRRSYKELIITNYDSNR